MYQKTKYEVTCPKYTAKIKPISLTYQNYLGNPWTHYQEEKRRANYIITKIKLLLPEINAQMKSARRFTKIHYQACEQTLDMKSVNESMNELNKS